MMNRTFNLTLAALLLAAALAEAQTPHPNVYNEQGNQADEKQPRLRLSGSLGLSCSYSDQAYLFSFPAAIRFDYHLGKHFYLQLAPNYSWVYKWNEHYLSLPLHLRKQFGQSFSLFAGPAVTWDVGYYNDLGLSAGAACQFSPRSSIILSVFTFTLYEYRIDYRYIPVGISYSYSIF